MIWSKSLTAFLGVGLMLVLGVEGDCLHIKYEKVTPLHTACIPPSPYVTVKGVSAQDQQLIVDLHNKFRGQTLAANIQKMVWDEELASLAQRWTENCVFEHDKYRLIPGRFPVGQNLAAGYESWTVAIQGWYNEVELFTYGVKEANNFAAVGHYTQMVWHESAKVGCGYAYCTNLSYKRFYACNYGPSGNMGDTWASPYRRGAAGSDCPLKNSGGLCDCKGKVCENGGTLNLNTCTCTCAREFHMADHCSLNCTAAVDSWSCGPGNFFDGKCLVYSNVPDECPLDCNICPYSGAEYAPKASAGKASEAGTKAFMYLVLGGVICTETLILFSSSRAINCLLQHL